MPIISSLVSRCVSFVTSNVSTPEALKVLDFLMKIHVDKHIIYENDADALEKLNDDIAIAFNALFEKQVAPGRDSVSNLFDIKQTFLEKDPQLRDEDAREKRLLVEIDSWKGINTWKYLLDKYKCDIAETFNDTNEKLQKLIDVEKVRFFRSLGSKQHVMPLIDKLDIIFDEFHKDIGRKDVPQNVEIANFLKKVYSRENLHVCSNQSLQALIQDLELVGLTCWKRSHCKASIDLASNCFEFLNVICPERVKSVKSVLRDTEGPNAQAIEQLLEKLNGIELNASDGFIKNRAETFDIWWREAQTIQDMQSLASNPHYWIYCSQQTRDMVLAQLHKWKGEAKELVLEGDLLYLCSSHSPNLPNLALETSSDGRANVVRARVVERQEVGEMDVDFTPSQNAAMGLLSLTNYATA